MEDSPHHHQGGAASFVAAAAPGAGVARVVARSESVRATAAAVDPMAAMRERSILYKELPLSRRGCLIRAGSGQFRVAEEGATDRPTTKATDDARKADVGTKSPNRGGAVFLDGEGDVRIYQRSRSTETLVRVRSITSSEETDCNEKQDSHMLQLQTSIGIHQFNRLATPSPPPQRKLLLDALSTSHRAMYSI